jgi:hypothetical protein
MREALGSVSHKQLESNLRKFNLCKPIRGIILESYSPASVKIVTLDASRME